MFIRIKTNPTSPRKSVQIVQSVRRGNSISQKIVRHVGVAMDDYELEKLKDLAEIIKVKLESGHQDLLFPPEQIAKLKKKAEKQKQVYTDEDYQVDIKKLREEKRVVSGIHDIYGELFDDLGYSRSFENSSRQQATTELLKNIVLARIANPSSKRESVQMLERDFGVTLGLDRVYKMMDKLDEKTIENIQNITANNSKALFPDKIDVLFFDATTLYFESFQDDNLRQCGFSKDHKFQEVQVVLALIVTKEGMPLGYEIFPGNTFEGHTFIPTISKMRARFEIDRMIVVADAGMMTKENIQVLENIGCEYILGARIKNMKENVQEKILNKIQYRVINEELSLQEIEIDNGLRLVVTYSKERAFKDQNDRNKAIEKAKKKFKKSTKVLSNISSQGGNKYLKLVGKNSIELDEQKIANDEKWDGLHGVITNAKHISSDEILDQYGRLWQIEQAFRITKHDLKIRPIYHWKPERIKAHIAISFIAYSLIKYLEYRVRIQKRAISIEQIRQALVRVQTSIVIEPIKKILYAIPSQLSQEAKDIYQILKKEYSFTPYIVKKM
jgi:transposase